MPRQGHNTPLPLERSPPASFKRLLGRGMSSLRFTGHRMVFWGPTSEQVADAPTDDSAHEADG